jgi:ectoine hydroxylase-related dioxygenase (phytanoyl-CoA dioxygenase family)
LFFEPGVGPSLLAHAVNVVVPLIDVDMETGPTGVWLGSHRVRGRPQGHYGVPVAARRLHRA